MTFFSKTTISMVLKFYMQHDQTAGLQTCKIQPGREFKVAADTKNSKTIKIIFFFIRMDLYMSIKFYMEYWCSVISK